MELNITKEQIEFFKYIISLAEPYPFEVLDDVGYEDNRYDEIRLNSTRAKKLLIEHGIEI